MPTAPVTTGLKKKEARPPPPLDERYGGPEHRQFPRALMEVPFRVWIGEEADRRFQAHLVSYNISVSGAFLTSTFFLPAGTELRCSFELDPDEDPVEARAQIIRQERPDSRGQGRSGLAIRFVEFYSQSEVTLAKLFIGQRLQVFAEAYLASKRARSLNNELDRCVDALAAWELQKVTSTQDAWALDGSMKGD